MKFCALLCLLLAFSLGNSFAQPTITVWYGLNQSFGQRGNPQTAVNILGNVTDANGIQSLNYSLNGGSTITLSRGPDTRRLLGTGDFNIDIYTSALNNGSNTVLITATNTLSQLSTQTVTVNYTAGQIWPTTYSIDWATAGTIQSVAQVTDGHWTLDSGTIRPTYLGYDRLVAIGDKTWTDYEATVPITISNIDSSGFGYPSNGTGVGLIFRWTGHTDNPLSGYQPKTGYLPLGAMGWYSMDTTGTGSRFSLVGNNLINLAPDNTSLTLSFGVTYYFKMRVVTLPGGGSEYKLKVWQATQTEPTTWLLEGVQSLANDPPTGSMLLAAHHVNATFGNVTIIPTQVRANIKALLQGPYSTPGDSMRTGLRGILPLTQPYIIGPWNYAGTESVASIPDSVVDWVLLELRTDTTAASKVGTRAAFIKRTGNIVDTDGVSSVTFNGVTPGNYYVVVRHRNHLAVMTSSPIPLSVTSSALYSFTGGQAYGTNPMAQIGSTFVLYAGDANSSTNISGVDATVVFTNVNSAAYLPGDTNMSGIVTSADASMVFDNLNKTSRVPAP